METHSIPHTMSNNRNSLQSVNIPPLSEGASYTDQLNRGTASNGWAVSCPGRTARACNAVGDDMENRTCRTAVYHDIFIFPSDTLRFPFRPQKRRDSELQWAGSSNASSDDHFVGRSSCFCAGCC